MAYFGIIKKSGELIQFQLPCFAWVGQEGVRHPRSEWDRVLIRPGFIPDHEGAYGENLSHYLPDFKFMVEKIKESSLRHDGLEITLEEGYDEFGPALSIKLDQSKPFGQTVRILKMAGKLISYSLEKYQQLLQFLQEGANLQEASFLVTRNYPYSYNYPYPRFVCKVTCKNYLQGGPMEDLTDWEKLNRLYTLKPFGFDQSQNMYVGANSGCHPLTMNNGHPIMATTLADLRKEFEYE